MTMTMSNNWQICSLFTLTLNSKTRNSIWHNWIRNESTNQELQAAHPVTKATLDMMSVCIASESSPLAVIIPIVGIPDGKGRIFTPSMASFASLMATHENHGLWSCFIFFTLPYRNPNYWHRPHLFRFHQLNWMVTRLQMTPNGSNGWQCLSLHKHLQQLKKLGLRTMVRWKKGMRWADILWKCSLQHHRSGIQYARLGDIQDKSWYIT